MKKPGSSQVALKSVGAALALAAALVSGCGGPPQVTGDRECLAAADALWTAVTARQGALVEQCDAELRRLHERSQMPDDAFENLEAIVADAQAGHWDTARAALKSFLRGQRPAPKG